MHHIQLVPLFVSLATASLLRRQISQKACEKHPDGKNCESEYLNSICLPNADTADINLEAPCNVQEYLAFECIYGQKPQVNKNGLRTPSVNPLSNSTQRVCVCENQYFDAVQGCTDCFKAHGGGSIPSSLINSMSSAYCVATVTPTLGILDFQMSFASKPQFSSIFSSNSAAATNTFSDPIGNKTDVSLYWTAPVTGTAILDVGIFTTTARQTTINVSDGQIVATASTSAETTANTANTANTAIHSTGMGQTGASQSASTTTTSGIAARQTEAVFAGFLGLVGVVAML